MKVELGEEACILRPMARIVNPGCDLIDEQAFIVRGARDEELDRHHAHETQGICQDRTKCAGGSGDFVADTGGNGR